ncbi:MAG: hypothetical protein COW16_13800, partial [Sphingomonadales bacterium CG12_big_fil_rev_8_21_14_0_65_65_10]
TIQNDVDAVKDRQSFFGTMIPEDLGAQLSNLKEQAGVAREQLGKAMVKAQEVSHDVLAEDAGTMDQRMAKLGEHAQDIMQDPTLAGFMDKINGMRSAENGEFKLDMVMSQLSAMMNGAHEIADNTDSSEGTVDSSMSALEQPSGHAQIFENLLVASREVNPVIGETFAGVPTSDLKAAVMLLGMTQFRSSLNRDNQAFDDDLNVLMGLVGEEDVEL